MLCQPVASQVYLLQLTPAGLTTLTLLIKVSAVVTVYRGHRQTLFFAQAYLPLYHVHRNYLK